MANNSILNSILALYKNKADEPRNAWSSNRFARQMVNSVLIVVVVLVLITGLIFISVIYSAFSKLF